MPGPHVGPGIMTYELFYWPGIPGRGEFIRLVLEEAAADYIDIALDPDASGLVGNFNDSRSVLHPSFAPPFLRDGSIVIGQVAAILFYLGPKLKLAPEDAVQALWTHQIQLTIADMVTEAHDTHHPVSLDEYYEDQKAEARKKAKSFRESRIPKFLDWFETVLTRNPDGDEYLVGKSLTYADLSLFHLISGLEYAFPHAMKEQLEKHPHIAALAKAVKARPRIKAYLSSKRHTAFNEGDIFRHYPALDKRAA